MLTLLDVLRWVHVIGATVLLGTGAGIAFFMLRAHRTGDARVIAHVAGTVVVADLLFTAAAVVMQPISGLALAYLTGWPLGTPWLVASIALYLVTGLCWLPVVWLQLRLRDLARRAASEDQPLPPRYHQLFRYWFALGIPAFVAVLAIIALMLKRPQW
ncbi:MAG: DUF2269 domain-containing protein [Burkholderiales bacterium]|nr:DUF2269 domain-containing protein [Burkholderiales bacterium]